MDIRSYNRRAWDQRVKEGDEWTIPVSPEIIRAARQGDWRIFLTRSRPVPAEWFPQIQGADVLCLASGGGQQAPVLAAAGAIVTLLDNSPAQLAQDRKVAQREGLSLTIIEGDMSDLSQFSDDSFDLIVNPVSNLFIPDIQPLWNECFRVLRHNGILISGFMNPAFFIFDRELMDDQGILEVRNALPYSDLQSLNVEKRHAYLKAGWPLEFGHTLEAQIGGQYQAGFLLAGLYEDRDTRCVLDDFMPVYIATRAIKP